MREDRPHRHESEASTSVRLNHTVVHATDRRLSAEFIATILGPGVGAPFGPFIPVDLGHGVALDHHEKRDEPIRSHHYAFLVPNDRFDLMIARPEEIGVTHYADPHDTEPGRINHLFDGRGACFDDPDGHNTEIPTRPYVRP
ncbi:VOC family protein [Streptomyces alkaliphilus]|uniref:VOC family protein n=1 Tax=Streptomyces alkaliphilus TaxID=1472722 RepID=A0A7W3Y2M8_9ACTN|nr:VOC family protein [Streptomyces alkaliphilus]MBB0245515.1 VOC family protein [Streptomyces alkaliphilus]